MFKHFVVYHHLAQTSYVLPVKHEFSILLFSSRPRNQTCLLRIMCPISSDHPRSRIIHCQKLESTWCISVADTMGLASVSLSKVALKANVVGEMKQNNGHYALQGHSISSLLIVIECPYATFYDGIILT